MWRSDDGGANWSLGGALSDEGIVASLAEGPDGEIYAGTQPSAKVFRSTNYAGSWTELVEFRPVGSTDAVYVWDLLVASNGYLYAAVVWTDGGIYRSTDGGAVWDAVGPTVNGATDLLEAKDGTIYAVGNGRVYRSDDDGDTWTRTSELTSFYSILETDDGAIWGARSVTGAVEVHRSRDRGATWEQMGILDGASQAYALLELDNGTIFAGTRENGDVFEFDPATIGEAARHTKDRIRLAPREVESTFLIQIRETTRATVPGGTTTYDVQVISQKAYEGTVTLGVTGLPAEAIGYTFDPAFVDVPGRSTLTVEWDPLLTPPSGGDSYPFQVTASDESRAVATVRTLDVNGVVIDPEDHYLTQYVNPVKPNVGHEVEVFGRLAPAEADQMVTVTTGGSLAVYTTRDRRQRVLLIDGAGGLGCGSSIRVERRGREYGAVSAGAGARVAGDRLADRLRRRRGPGGRPGAARRTDRAEPGRDDDADEDR